MSDILEVYKTYGADGVHYIRALTNYPNTIELINFILNNNLLEKDEEEVATLWKLYSG